MTEVFDRVLDNQALQQAVRNLQAHRHVSIGGVWGSAGALVAGAVAKLADTTVFLVTTSSDQADDAADDIAVLTGANAQVFPAWEESITGASDHVSDEITAERMRLCKLLSLPPGERAEKLDVLVAPVMSLLQPVPTAQTLAEAGLTLRTGDEQDPVALMAWLVDAGFEQVDQVDQQGEFAHRGGIIDIVPPGLSKAVRMEFFGDQVESIRLFDLDTQRSTEEIGTCLLTDLAAGRDFGVKEAAMLPQYLTTAGSHRPIVCLAGPDELRDLADDVYRRVVASAEERAKHRTASYDPANDPAARVFDPADVFEKLASFPQAELYTFAPKRSSRPTVAQLDIRSAHSFSPNTTEAIGELVQLARSADVWVYCETPAEQQRFTQLLAEADGSADNIHTALGHVAGGFHWPAQKLMVIGHHEMFHRYARHRRLRQVRTGRPIESLLDLSAGEYVVHVAHGIARFDGLRQLTRDDRKEEYLTLKFAGNATLHVPVSQINLVQKYIGTRKMRPTLSKLGTGAWARRKESVDEAVHDLAAEMLRVQAMRQAIQGNSYPKASLWQEQFADEFLYSETEDQILSMDQIGTDMAVVRPMDRLLCGDVGYGKTELAMRAAFKVVEGGKQVAVLVPTTVLAEQHYRTFTERMADYPFTVEMLSRFRKPPEQRQIVKNLALGRIDVLIGTHRILSPDVRFGELGLAIVDEEQRFGVEHKEHLKQMRASVDVLTLTATPIPRTLHMALLGLRDISSLTTAPLDRRAIQTEVCHYDDGLVRMAIARELNRQGQVFFVHNRVRDIKSLADRIRGLAGDAVVEVAHGQMAEGALEKVMLRFVRQEIDVLVCTTIVESGLDIPSANTMIIHNADMFGLSQLHQLRGRVGRYKHRAFCYLLLPETKPVTPIAAKRLRAIEEFSDLGAGFQIAMRDLELRGAGNILGKAQSGHIAAVGYELYCQILERTVRKLRGEQVPTEVDVHVELGLEAYVPRSYVASDRQRMEVYRRLAGCSDHQELEQLSGDLVDAYGRIPPEAETLIDLAQIRAMAGKLGVESIIRMGPDLVFTVSDFSRAQGIFENAAGSVRLPDPKTVHWRPPKAYCEMPTLLTVLIKRLRQATTKV